MRCSNCNKEINPQSNYCEYCGEEINSNKNNIEYNSELNSQQINDVKNTLIKNKKIVAIIAGVIVLAIAVVVGIKIFKGQPLSENEIKKEIADKTIIVANKEIKLNDKNIEKFKITKRKTDSKKTDSINIEIKLKYKEMKATIDYYVNFYYSEDKWKLYSNDYEVTDIDIGEDPLDAIKEAIMSEELLFTSDYIEVDVSQIKSIGDIEYDKDNETFEAKVEFTNGIYKTDGIINGKIYLDTSELIWNVNSIQITKINKATKESKVDEKVINETVKAFLMEKTFYGWVYKYEKDGEIEEKYVLLPPKSISEIKVIDYLEQEKEGVIKIEFEGKASDEIIKNAEFKGSISIPVTIGEDEYDFVDTDVIKYELVGPEESEIIQQILDYKVYDKKISASIAKSFKRTKEFTRDINEYYVNGTVDINGEIKNIQVEFNLSEDNDTDKLYWEVYDVYEEDEAINNDIE